MDDSAGRTILVADDDFFYREMVSSHLESLGYSVTIAKSGTQAHRLLRSGRRFDLAVIDVFMEGMSGIEVLKRLRQSADLCEIEDVPVIIMSIDDSEATEIRIRVAKANVFLLKPFSKEELAVAVGLLARAKAKAKAKAGGPPSSG